MLIIIKMNKIDDVGKIITLDIQVLEHIKSFNQKSPLKIITQTNSKQILNILFFGSFKSFYIKKFQINNFYRITGKLQFFSNTYQIIHPINILNNENSKSFENIEPIYNLSRKNINRKKFRGLILSSLDILSNHEFPEEWILDKFMDNNWLSFKESLAVLHNPKKYISKIKIENLRQRLAYDELLANFLVFQKLKKKQKEKNKFIVKNFENSEIIINSLNFELTKDQVITYKQIKKDISSSNKMYRLIQGDVGSGKTIISLLAVVDFINAGMQCVIMVPTEILAKQHYKYFQSFLSKFKINIQVLTSKTKK